MEQKLSTSLSGIETNEGPPETTQNFSVEVTDNVNDANYSSLDSDDLDSCEIVSSNETALAGVEPSKTGLLVSTSCEGGVNKIEVIGNSDETEQNDKVTLFPSRKSSPLLDISRGSQKTKVNQSMNKYIDDTSSEDEPVEDGRRSINCNPSGLDAMDTLMKTASSKVKNPKFFKSELGGYWFFDRGQFVNCKIVDSILCDIYSCQLRYDWCTVYIRKQENEYLLTIDEQRFIARVSIDPLNSLNLYSFNSFKQNILAMIRVIRVVEDELLEERNLFGTKFAQVLETAVNSEDSDKSSQVLINCLRLMKNQEPLISLEQLSVNCSIPVELRSASCDLLGKERSLLNRNLPIAYHRCTSFGNLKDVIRQSYSLGIHRHQKRLIDYCPPALPRLRTKVENMSPEMLSFVSKADVSVFHHVLTITNEPEIMPFFEYLLDDFIERVQNINNQSSFADVTPLVNPILGFLFKSFWEIMGEIRGIVGPCSYADLLVQRRNRWGLTDFIQWPIPKKERPHHNQNVYKSLECQFKFVFKLMKHFYPNGPWKTSGFQYQMQLQHKKQPWWKTIITTIRQGCSSHLRGVCEERKIWLYLMDHTIEHVVIDRICSFEEFFNVYKPLMVFHCEFITNSITESVESFRLVTHSILRYIVQTSQFFMESDISCVLHDIQSRQMSTLTQIVEDRVSDESSFTCSRGLIDEYAKFWDLQHALASKCREIPDFLAGQLNESVDLILQIVRDALGMSAPIKALSEFLNRINEFLAEYQNMDFVSTWYVKSKNPNHSGLTKVQNKIAEEIDCSYLVTDLNNYLNSIGDSERPPHYNIQIVRKLIDCVNSAFEKTWDTGELPVVGRLDATSTLLGAIRSSLVYLKEQPDYRDFAKYEKDSTELFVRAVNNCSDLRSFKTRVGVISESCWYLRKKDEIGVDRALEMLEPMFGDTIEKNVLKSGYFRYTNKFHEHVENTACKDSTDEKILQIFDDLKSHIVDNCVEKWDGSFKTETVPEILAGLSVIWSLMKSKDVTTGENLLQPHCIQILCALRLLAVDRECAGAKNHLAQILTGQGKSVVLALVASVFAFTGHNVFIVCYSSYLVNRDDFEFKCFFNALQLTKKIEYITVKSMAAKCMYPTVNGSKQSLRTCLKNHILQCTPLPNLASASFNFSNTILLIDEVDVFFSDDIYGSQYYTATRITIPGLAKIQEHMWTTVTSGVFTANELLEETEKYVTRKIQSGDSVITQFDKIRKTVGSFRVLENEYGQFVEKHYSSKQDFIEKHFREMAIQAISVSTTKHKGNIMINENGLICYKDNIDGIFSSAFMGYDLSFSYFKLKSRDFDCKNGQNYGYLSVDAGRFSYAKLPTDFLLVLGVTGTLRNVYGHEKKAMQEFYNIANYTDCPSFYGSSIVKFDPKSDFTILESVDQWRCGLFEHAYSQIQLGRAVIMFFAHENEIPSFVRDFGDKFATLNVLTENTNSLSKKLFIDCAGAPATLTLASSGIGRGTDFKSSLAVERNGGVHVIQSFFSRDRKEETQIRGRTARKDNKGSYELILCRQHLLNAQLLDNHGNTTVTYSQLDESRTRLRELQGAKSAAKIEKHYVDHATTMKFYGLK